LKVPLSYDNPAQASIELKVIKLPASEPGKRIGSLVMNPGGPGGSGIDYARAARGVTTDALRARYDIVGWDPRGVGTSDPIHCQDAAQTDAYIAADASPDTPAEVTQLESMSAEIGKGCAAKSPTLLDHVGTIEAARDIDILRAALGDDQLHYLGKSYGTYLGATYADLFPTKVARMVLDGALDPALDSSTLALGQAKGFELALHRFAEKCATLPECPLSANADEAVQQVRDFLNKTDSAPLTTNQSRPLTQALAVLAVVGSLYDNEQGWPALAQALGTAFKGDGSDLMATADYYTDRNANGSYNSNANDAIYAVNCFDKPATPGLTETEKLAAEWEKIAPTFGAYLAWGNLPCATWPSHSTTPSHPVKADGSPPIVVIGTTYDPATPVEWAKGLAAELSNGVYLEWNGDGHTAYQRGSTCVDNAVDAYLLDGTAPTSGTVCS